MSEEITKWADPAMYASEPMPYDIDEEIRPKASLLSVQPDPLGAIAAMAMIYEGKVCRDIMADVTDEMRKHYWEEVKKTHLKAPLEAVDLHFMIEGVTRSFTHQMVRQRTAVYAQESLRFAVKDKFYSEVPLPPSLVGLSPDSERVRRWRRTIDTIETEYRSLVSEGVPAEDARGLLPHAVTTRLHYKTNLRNLLEHAGNRLCTQAQFEWRVVIAEVVNAIKSHRPPRFLSGLHNYGQGAYDAKWQFEHIAEDEVFKPVCYALGKCPFNADFDRGCTIRPRVEEGKFDDIDPREWLLDPAAARR